MVLSLQFRTSGKSLFARLDRIITNFPLKSQDYTYRLANLIRLQANANIYSRAAYRHGRGQWHGLLEETWSFVTYGNKTDLINYSPHALAIEKGDAKVIGPHLIPNAFGIPGLTVQHPGVGGGTPPSPLIKHFIRDAVVEVQRSGKAARLLKEEKFME